MSNFTWPTELDDARRLLTVVGSFWAETYASSDFVGSFLHAKAQSQVQAQLDLYELLASFSRFNLPVFHKENWSILLLRESELNSSNLPVWDGTYNFDSGLNFDTPVDSSLFIWPAPAGLANAQVITNQITQASLTFTRGVDFILQNDTVRFRSNPFSAAEAAPVQLFENGQPVDRVLYLWVYSGEYDWDTVYKQFGYVLDLKLKSSRTYKEVVNAVYDGLVEGTTSRCVEDFMSAVCDVALVKGTEVVKYILEDATGKWVITDKNAYGYASQATVTVAVGDTVVAGQTLTDTLTFHDFNRGQLPNDMRALALSSGTLSAAFFRELVFENKVVPLVVEEDVDGYTKVSFEIGGWTSDVSQFWDTAHQAGIQSGETLAMHLDTRSNKTGQPTVTALPSTVNPAKFLVENIYRGNTFWISVKPQAFGRDAVGMHAARYLRKLIPPQTLCLLFIEQQYSEILEMTGAGSATQPGYEEDALIFLCSELTETIDPSDYVVEEVRMTQIGGYCT